MGYAERTVIEADAKYFYDINEDNFISYDEFTQRYGGKDQIKGVSPSEYFQANAVLGSAILAL